MGSGHPDQDPSGALEPHRLVGAFVRSDIVASALRTRLAVEVDGGGTCAGITLVYSGRSCLLVVVAAPARLPVNEGGTQRGVNTDVAALNAT